MAQESTTALAALPVGAPSGPVNLQATEKNVVVANMAAELAAKRDAEMATPAAPVAPASPAGATPAGKGDHQAGTAAGLVPPAEQASFARGVASAAATGALSLPSRDIVGSPAQVVADPRAQVHHVPAPQVPNNDYVAELERAQLARAQAAAVSRRTESKWDLAEDGGVQAAAIAGVLFLITQLPATRALAVRVYPKMFSGAGGLKTGAAVAAAAVFGLSLYGAIAGAAYMSD